MPKMLFRHPSKCQKSTPCLILSGIDPSYVHLYQSFNFVPPLPIELEQCAGWAQKNGPPIILYNVRGLTLFLTPCRISQIVFFDLPNVSVV